MGHSEGLPLVFQFNRCPLFFNTNNQEPSDSILTTSEEAKELAKFSKGNGGKFRDSNRFYFLDAMTGCPSERYYNYEV